MNHSKPKPINGRENEYGVILPLQQEYRGIFDITPDDEKENSLIYRVFISGKVKVAIYLAEFEDGRFACSSDFITKDSGRCSYINKLNKRGSREEVIGEELDELIESIQERLDHRIGIPDPKTESDCRKVLGMIKNIEQRSLSLIF